MNRYISSKNHTDTAIGSVTSFNLSIPALNYIADMRVSAETPEEAILSNLTSPIDAKETFRFAESAVSDVYKGTDIDPTYATPSKRGLSLVSQVKGAWTLSDHDDAAFQALLPVSCHLVLKFPTNAAITGADLSALVARCVAGLFEGGTSDDKRLKAMTRGALKPTSM